MHADGKYAQATVQSDERGQRSVLRSKSCIASMIASVLSAAETGRPPVVRGWRLAFESRPFANGHPRIHSLSQLSGAVK